MKRRGRFTSSLVSNDVPVMKAPGVALFPETTDYAPQDYLRNFEPITCFEQHAPPFCSWQGGKDEQVPPVTLEKCVALLKQHPQKNEVLFVPGGQHSPAELATAYQASFGLLAKKVKQRPSGGPAALLADGGA